MTKADLAAALRALGYEIDRIEDHPINAPFRVPLVHAYLRIHHYLVKTSTYPLRESRATVRALLSLGANAGLRPCFLPCHKLPIQSHLLPCIRPDDVCHCAKLLQCDLEEDDIFS